MANTPLYKFMKKNGTTFYAFPGASEDIASAYQNDNLTMNFDKFVLLNIPKQDVNNEPIKLDFDTAFYDNQTAGSVPAGFSDQLVESLRNYVANFEITMKDTKLSDNEYYYDNTILSTPTEKIFWKWCRDLGILDLEMAVPNDEYLSNLADFTSNDITDDEYFPGYLWKERELTEWRVPTVYNGASFDTYVNPLTIEFVGDTNIINGDWITFNGFTNTDLLFLNNQTLHVVSSVKSDSNNGQIIMLDYTYTGGTLSESSGTTKIAYERLVKYIGEITSVNNVTTSNKSYTEVIAHVGDQQGSTPDILFQTTFDNNYKPNAQFPLLPYQYQPEIRGAENYSSPIRNNPQNYPGNYWAQYDTTNYTYETASGDTLRRSGEYYGVSGDIYDIIVDTSNIDGIGVDFNTDHYAKMNIINNELSNFDEFNGMEINNQPPQDFEYNAVLWYYNVTDISGNISKNLYGIEFLDNADNNQNPNLVGIKIPTYKKLVTNGLQDGTSYNYSLNLNYYISDDQVQPLFDPSNINTLFSFELYNDAMRKLASANSNFNKVIAENNELSREISKIKQLSYTTTSVNEINKKIDYLNNLLNLYSTLQIVTTDTIEVMLNDSGINPVIELKSIDSKYINVLNINTTDMYNIDTGIIVYNVDIPINKDFMLNMTNDDTNDITFENENDKLTLVLNKDLAYKQTVDIIIDATDTAFVNKQLDIWMKFDASNNSIIPVNTPIITDIDLPVYYNQNTQLTNSARNLEQYNYNTDLMSASYSLELNNNESITVPVINSLGLIVGDQVFLNNLSIGVTESNDYSGQYIITDIDVNNITLDITSNSNLVNYIDSQTDQFPISINDDLRAIPFINFNQGIKFSITRINENSVSDITQRYKITKSSIN